ncbi:MAG: hypothetical protein EOP34_03350 [Rickettsiales bacterium]|nr:MAG: hypothetical protein EOP34_03350 [Rickettsiales bacterium]
MKKTDIQEKKELIQQDYDILINEMMMKLNWIHPCAVVLIIFIELIIGYVVIRDRNYFTYLYVIFNMTLVITLNYYVLTVKKIENEIWHVHKKWLKNISLPILLVWNIMYLHHIVWDTSQLYEMSIIYTVICIVLSSVTAFMPILASILDIKSNTKHLIQYLKWITIIVMLCTPLYRPPWYHEYRLTSLLRIFCFTSTYCIYCKTAYNFFSYPYKANGSHILILKTIWIINCHPWTLAYAIMYLFYDVTHIYDDPLPLPHISNKPIEKSSPYTQNIPEYTKEISTNTLYSVSQASPSNVSTTHNSYYNSMHDPLGDALLKKKKKKIVKYNKINIIPWCTIIK